MTFTGETATGWQSAMFSTPVAVAAGRPIWCPTPRRAVTMRRRRRVARGVDAAPLTVPGGCPNPAGVFATRACSRAVAHPLLRRCAVLHGGHLAVDRGSSSPSPAPPASRSPRPSRRPTPSLRPPAPPTSATQGSSGRGTSAYDSTTRKVTFTPDAALAASTSYTARSARRTRSVPRSRSVVVVVHHRGADQVPGAATVSFYNDSDVPETLEAADPGPVTVGVSSPRAWPGRWTGSGSTRGRATPGRTGHVVAGQ